MKTSEFKIDRQTLEITNQCVLDAPRERVWQAYTSAEAIPKWWGPARYKTIVDMMDVREGGDWRFIQKDENGEEVAFSGQYTEVVDFELLSYTFEYEPVAGHVLNESVKFEMADGGDKTKVTITTVYDNLEDLDGMVDSGMEAGATESLQRLARLVENDAVDA